MATLLASEPEVEVVDARPAQPAAKKLRVCHVSLTLCTGGLERLLVEFARKHHADQWEHCFLALGEIGKPADDIRDSGCRVVSIPFDNRSRLQAVRELAEWFRQEQFDVVHTHNAFPHIYATIAARWAGVPVVVHTRHGRRFGGNLKERCYFALASRLADRVIGVSDDTADLCRRLGKLRGKKVSRIWNGIDLDRFAYRGPKMQPTAISVARLSAEKDFPTLLKAVALVKPELPEFRLQLVGDGPEREQLRKLADELEINEQVEFLGERQDVPELLAEAGFFVSSSKTEGISLTLLEAMAVGLPVLATNVGGNAEIVETHKTGYLTPAEEPEVLAANILLLCQQQEYWSQMGLRGRQRVERHFSIKQMVGSYESLYLELLESKQRKPRK